jgi:hypothetical protein
LVQIKGADPWKVGDRAVFVAQNSGGNLRSGWHGFC